MRNKKKKKSKECGGVELGLKSKWGACDEELRRRNVNFLKSIFDVLLIHQKIDKIKCKLWGRPPPPFWKKFTF